MAPIKIADVLILTVSMLVLSTVVSAAQGSTPEDKWMAQHQSPHNRACITIHEIAHGHVTCSRSGCRMRCRPGYAFFATDQGRPVTLDCDRDTGRLTFRGLDWIPEMTLCAPVCATACRNGGTCVAPNKCACRSVFTGDHCEGEPMLGDQPYQGYQPSGALKSNQRRVECEPGTRMPDGSTSVTLSYRDNSWFYPDGKMLLGVDQVTCEKGPDIKPNTPQFKPESKPRIGHQDKPQNRPRPNPQERRPNRPPLEPLTAPRTHFVPSRPSGVELAPRGSIALCSPPCRNGGQCVMADTCSCPQGYSGRGCEDTSCTYPRFEGDINASVSGTAFRMQFECPPGSNTGVGRVSVVANCSRGVWRLPGGRLLIQEDVQCLPRTT